MFHVLLRWTSACHPFPGVHYAEKLRLRLRFTVLQSGGISHTVERFQTVTCMFWQKSVAEFTDTIIFYCRISGILPNHSHRYSRSDASWKAQYLVLLWNDERGNSFRSFSLRRKGKTEINHCFYWELSCMRESYNPSWFSVFEKKS